MTINPGPRLIVLDFAVEVNGFVAQFETDSYLCIKARQMDHMQLYTKINSLPGDLKSEVNDFIDFLMSKRQKEIKKNGNPIFKQEFLLRQRES
jgi:hypothetical protein